MISADALLAGADREVAVEIPERLLPEEGDREVRLRPLTVRDLRLIGNAARENEDLAGVLMLRQSLTAPELSTEQLAALPAGVFQFLLGEVNRISGISAAEDEVMAALEDPLVKASLTLSREFGWTPEEVGRLTLGETMLHVAALRSRG